MHAHSATHTTTIHTTTTHPCILAYSRHNRTLEVAATDYVITNLPYLAGIPLQTPLLTPANTIAHEECSRPAVMW